ncbi:MAG TPA: hypothetical protein VKA63_08155 [Candidatus Krumholzibacteria bacterium]|nr:hypothetical protein [Candidatus Krumholzibacteria bacterium]
MLTVVPTIAWAQSRPMPLRRPPVQEGPKHIWALHIMFSAPEPLIGAAVHYVPAQGWGGYGSLWIATSSTSDETYYYKDLDRSTVEGLLGGVPEKTVRDWGGGRAGLTRRMSRQFYTYGGIGFMRSHNFTQYKDALRPAAGPDGRLWIDAPDRDTMKFVAELGAVLYTESGFAFSLGIGTFPVGVNVGLGFGTKL